MKSALIFIGALVVLVISACESSRGSGNCATNLTYVTNQFTSGDDAIRHASEYRMGLFMGADDFVVTAKIDTSSANLVVNEKNYEFGALTATGSKPFVYQDGSARATAINAKDVVDIGCIENRDSRFTIAARDSSIDNVLGLSFGDPDRRAHEKKGQAFFDQLVEKEGINNIFSLALCRGVGKSRLVLGGVDNDMKDLIRTYIPMSERTAYVVPALSIRLGDSKKHLAHFPSYDARTKEGVRTIIDSSSAFLLLPSDMAVAISDEVQKSARTLNLIDQFPDGFFRTERGATTKVVRFANQAQIRQFPPLEIGFRGQDGSVKNLQIPAQQYLKQIDSDDSLVRTFAVRETSNDIILGQPFLESHYTVFDRSKGLMGFGDIDVACVQ